MQGLRRVVGATFDLARRVAAAALAMASDREPGDREPVPCRLTGGRALEAFERQVFAIAAV
jgi:hypothetical protein